MRLRLVSGLVWTNAANCLGCVHVGHRCFLFGIGTRPNSYGFRLEVLTPQVRLRWSPGRRGMAVLPDLVVPWYDRATSR
jgi:hypothetical protein